MTQHHDPVHPEPGDLEPMPALADADDAFVRSLLADLPEVTMPAEVAARIHGALDAEPRQPLATPLAAETAVGTVVPLAPRRARLAPLARILPAAAALILVAGGLVFGWQALRGVGSDSATGGATRDAAGPESGYTAPTRTGTAYTKAALPDQVRALLSGAGGGASPASVAKDLAGAGGLLDSPDRLASCLAAVEEGGPTVLPLAVDAGTFEGRPALVIVLPSTQPGARDVFVVAAGCSQADAQLLHFARVVG